VDISLCRPLLCRVSLLPDELLGSYLARLAAANCYEPSSILTRLCSKYLAGLGLRDNLAHPKHPETYDILASLGCLTPRELANASVHYFAQAPILAKMENSSIYLSDGASFQLLDSRIRSRYLLRDHHVQLCPDCLRELAYHRLNWTLTDVLVCLKHQRLLLDHCPDCHAWVRIQDVVRCQCSKCGADLTDATTDDFLEPFGVFAQRIIRAWWGLDVLEADNVAWKPPDQKVYVLHRLFETLLDSIKAETSVARTPLDRYKVQLRAFKALTDWPKGFCDFLRGRLEHEVRIHSCRCWCDFSRPVYLRNDSSFAFWICGIQNWPGFGFIQEAVDRFLAKNNVEVHADSWSNRILVEADEELQRIARPIAQRAMERVSKIVERL
jgi:hypothetical protein